MQVYALVTDGTRYLIARKRIVNAFWEYGEVLSLRVVNQAGQWALPGGGREEDETTEECALREFREETGVKLSTLAGAKRVNTYSWRNFEVAEFLVSQTQLTDLYITINANLQPKVGVGTRPTGLVRDWELSETRLVTASEMRQYLGVHVDITGEPGAVRVSSGHHTQAIDWYGDVASYAYFNFQD